jgi:hypothetical protein
MTNTLILFGYIEFTETPFGAQASPPSFFLTNPGSQDNLNNEYHVVRIIIDREPRSAVKRNTERKDEKNT